jgi:hypothetical protein
MFRRVAASLSVAALSAGGLLAAAPLAQAAPAPVPTDDDTGIALLNDLTVLPVQACGLDVGVPILSDILDATDAAPDATCTIVDDGADDD